MTLALVAVLMMGYPLCLLLWLTGILKVGRDD